MGTVIQRERVVCFKAYHFILSCIFTSKPLSMQISLAWTVDSPITSYFFSFALTAPCCAWALAQWRCMGVYVCVSVCRGDFFFLLVCKFGGRQIWVCMHAWMNVWVCVHVCLCSLCVCRYMIARHMALSCPGTVLCSPDVLLFYHPPLAPCSLRVFENLCCSHSTCSVVFGCFVGKNKMLFKAFLFSVIEGGRLLQTTTQQITFRQ